MLPNCQVPPPLPLPRGARELIVQNRRLLNGVAVDAVVLQELPRPENICNRG